MLLVTEMDRSKFKRPGTQKPSQTKNRNFGNSVPSPKFNSSRPANFLSSNNLLPGNKRLPVLRPMKSIVALKEDFSKPEAALPTNKSVKQSTPLDMGLPGAESPSTPGRLNRFKLPRRARRNLTRGLAVAIVLVLTFGGLLFSQSYIKLHKVFKGSTATAAALQVNVNPSVLKGEGSGRINILLLGRGGGDHDGPDLTDSMILDSVDPVNHTSTLISIPRDLWVNIPGAGAMKINASWETGEFKYLGKVESGSTNPKAIQAGYNEVDQTVKSVLGVHIDYNVLVNFQAFQQAVGAVGGVTVNVPTDLVDPTMAWENNNNPVLATAGVDNFNGIQALNYVRSRETTSDFARAQRQRAVLLALKTKVETVGTLSNPIKIADLIDSFGNNVSTNLSIKDATRLFSIIKDIPDSKVSSVGLADSPNNYVTTGILAGQSIDLPTAGLFDYTAIQQFIRTQLKDPYILKENAKVLVLNGTQTPGLATNLASELETYGYNVIGAANAPTTDWSSTTLYDLNAKDPYTKNYLEQRFGQKAKTVLNDKSINTDGADFVIIIGTNEANTKQS
jgi:LCP family protein required for cell wall assembly